MGVRIKKRLTLLQLSLVILISIVLIAVILTMVSANVILEKNEHQPYMQKLPFVNSLYFCPTVKAVGNKTLDKNSVLIVKKRTSYREGDIVVIPNTGTIYEPTIPLLLGEVTQVKQKLIEVKVGEKDIEVALVAADAVYGTVYYNLPYLGGVYRNLIGFRGYLFFGLIPLIVGGLLVALVLKPTSKKTANKSIILENTDIGTYDIEVLVAEVIRTSPLTAPDTNGGNIMDERPIGMIEVIERINDATAVVTYKEGYIDDVSEEQSAQTIQQETNEQRSERQLDEITKLASEIDFGETANATETATPPPTFEAEENKADDSHEVLLDAEDEVVPSMVVAAVQLQVEKEFLADVKAANLEHEQPLTLPKKLPANEIVKLYRLSKQTKDEQKNASDNELFTMAKLYYDSDIESYSKN